MHRRVLPLIVALALGAPTAAHATIAFEKPTSARIWVAADDGSGARALPARGADAAISPDGSRVAYVASSRADVGASVDLRVMDIVTGVEVRSSGLSDYVAVRMPRWSPDGTRLLVGTQTAGRGGILTGEGLAVVDARSGVATTVVAPVGRQVAGYAWSPDGARIAYDVQGWGGGMTRARLRTANPDGTGVVDLGRGMQPLWGPTRIAYERIVAVREQGMRAYHGQVWTVDPAAGAASARRLTSYRSPHPLILGPSADAWTPDGSRLVGSLGGDDYVEPILIDASSGRITVLRDARGRRLYGTDPDAVSADGRTLLLGVDVTTGNGTLGLMPIGGGRIRPFLRGAWSASVSPGWQP